jgi:hypothetical protein
MGVQASITIAILKAYSKLKLKNNTPILLMNQNFFYILMVEGIFTKSLEN